MFCGFVYKLKAIFIKAVLLLCDSLFFCTFAVVKLTVDTVLK